MYKSLIVFGLLCELISGQIQSSHDETVKDTPSKRQVPINDIISLDLDSPSDIHIKIIKENNNQKFSEVDDGLLMYNGARKHEKLGGLKPLESEVYYKDFDFDDHGEESVDSNQQIGRFHSKNDRNSHSKFRGGSSSHVTQINKLSDGREFKLMRNNHGASYHHDNSFIEQVKHNSPRKDENQNPENEGIMIVNLENESPVNVLQNYRALSDKGLKPVSINNDNHGKISEFTGRGVGNVENDCEHRENYLKIIHEGKKQQFHEINNNLFPKTKKQPLQKPNCGGFERESLESDGPSISYNEREGGEMIEQSNSSNGYEDDSINNEKSRFDNSKFGNVREENHAMSSDNSNKLDEKNRDEYSLISGHGIGLKLEDGNLKGHTNFGDQKIDAMINRDYSGDRSNCETVDGSPIIEKKFPKDVDDHDTLTSFDELDTDNRTNNLVANSDQSGVSYELNNENMEYKNYNDDQRSRKDLTDYGKNHRSYIDNQNMQRSQSSKDIPSNGREFEDIANHMLNKLNVKYLESGKNHSNVRKNHKFSINKDSSMNHRYFKHDFKDQENESVNKNDGNSENGLSQEEERYKDKSDENYGSDLDSQGGKFHKKNHGNFENDITHQVNGLDSNSNRIFKNNFNPKGSEYDEKFNVKFGNKQKNEYKSNVQIENYLKKQESVSDRRNHYQKHESDSADQEENVDTRNHDNFGNNNIINQQGNGKNYNNQGDGIIQDDRRVKNDDANRNSKFYSSLKNRGGSDPHDKKQELNFENGDKNHLGSGRSNEKHDSSSENDDKYNFGTVRDDEEDDSNSRNGVGSFDRHKILMDAIRNRFRGTTGSYFPEKTEKTPSGSEEDVEFSPRKSSRPICHDVTPEAHCIKEEDKYFCKIGKSSYTIYTGPSPSVSSKVIEDYVRSMFQKYGEGDRCLDMSFGAGKHGPCLKNKMPVDNQMSLSSQKTAISSKLYPGRKRGTLNIICTPLAPPPKGVDCRDSDAPPPKGVDCRDSDGTGREVYYECRWRTPNKIVEC